MIGILDKVIYGLGALTLVGVTILIIVLLFFFLAAITIGIADSIKKTKNNKKTFGG